MRIYDKSKMFDCFLIDDGTLDTVISVNGTDHRFDCEYASVHRDADGSMKEEGFTALCREIISFLD